MGHCEMRNFAKDWLEYLDQTGDDVFFQFMIRWMAFNWLYESEYEYHHPQWRRNNNDVSELQRIKEYIERYKELFIGLKRSITKIKFEELTVKPIDGNKYFSEDYYDLLYERTDIRVAKALISTIYHIRCNLFHGDKNPYDDRDKQLVKESSYVLEIILRKLIDKHAFE